MVFGFIYEVYAAGASDQRLCVGSRRAAEYPEISVVKKEFITEPFAEISGYSSDHKLLNGYTAYLRRSKEKDQ